LTPSRPAHYPILDSAGLDDVFDAGTPEVLQFDGNGPNAKLVGFDYYVRTNTGLPPEGFAGTNDWWHHHPRICFRRTDAAMVGFNISDSSCSALNAINVNMANYYMLHVWIVDDMKFIPRRLRRHDPVHLRRHRRPRPAALVPLLPHRDGRHGQHGRHEPRHGGHGAQRGRRLSRAGGARRRCRPVCRA
jgi:hypothetical protein